MTQRETLAVWEIEKEMVSGEMKMEFVTFSEDIFPPPPPPTLPLIFWALIQLRQWNLLKVTFSCLHGEKRHRLPSLWRCCLCLGLEKRFFTHHPWEFLWVCGGPEITHKMHLEIWGCVCGKRFPSFNYWVRGVVTLIGSQSLLFSKVPGTWTPKLMSGPQVKRLVLVLS